MTDLNGKLSNLSNIPFGVAGAQYVSIAAWNDSRAGDKRKVTRRLRAAAKRVCGK